MKHVKQLIAYGENAGNAVLAGGYTLAKTTLAKMYALADEDREWMFEARLSTSQREALTEAIAAVDTIELVVDGVEGDDNKTAVLSITLATVLSTWQADLIALE